MGIMDSPFPQRITCIRPYGAYMRPHLSSEPHGLLSIGRTR